MRLYLPLFVLLFSPGLLTAQSYSFPDWTLELNNKGSVTALKDNHTGRNHVVPDQPAPLVSIKTKDSLLLPLSARYANNKVILSYEGGIIITINISRQKHN